MQLAIRTEPDPDFSVTARLASEAFGTPGAGFEPDRLRWLYEEAFSAGSTVLGLYAGDAKVGQVVLLRQRVRLDGTEALAAALVDLFILKAHRSRDAIAGLYRAVEGLCGGEGARFILAVPNGKAIGVNTRFLKLQEGLRLDIRAGIAAPWAGRTIASGQARTLGRARATALFARFLPDRSNGLAWTPDSLWHRLQDPCNDFGIHATDDVLLISSRRVRRRIPHTLLCAFVARTGAEVAAGDIRAVTAAAAQLHGVPMFVYVGVNAAVPLPGWSLPERLRPSIMILQQRDFATRPTPNRFDRFEALDFDFA